MNKKYFIVSPNEEVALHKKAFEESKINRLKKVREQEKLASTSLLNQTKNINIECVQDILKHLRIEFEGKQKEDVNILLEQLNNRLKSIGEGHNIANKENFGKMKELTVAERALITKRYKRAINKILEEKAKNENSIAEQSKLRNKIVAMEENRKQTILLLPKPCPDPIINLKPVKVNSSITKNQTAESFSLSYHNLQSTLQQAHYPEIFVEKVLDENQINAKLAADEEEVKHKALLEKRMNENNERLEKAELRHKHALREIQLKQQKEDLIGELDHLELKERLKKKNIANKVPTITQYQWLQDSKMKQMSLEQAFENAYNPTAGILMENSFKTNEFDDSSEDTDSNMLPTPNQSENEVKKLNENSLPIPLSRLEKLRLHIKQQKKDQLKSLEDLVVNKAPSSDQNESNLSKNESQSSKMIATHQADSLQSMNISSACERRSWTSVEFSSCFRHAPSVDQSASSSERGLSSERTSSNEKTSSRVEVSNEKLTSAKINYTQHLLEHQQQVLKFQESLLKTQILNTALTSSCTNHVTTSSDAITQKLTQSSSKLSMSSRHSDNSSLKQYSLSKVDNHFSSIGHHATSQQASEHSVILEKMTCEVQIQTSFIEVDDATQTSFNEQKNNLEYKSFNESSKPQENMQDHIIPKEYTLDYPKHTKQKSSEIKNSSKLNSDVVSEKIKNKKIALRQQYPELFMKNSTNPTDSIDLTDSTDRVRNYKQHIKDQQVKLKLIRDSKKEKKETEMEIPMNDETSKEKTEITVPTTFLDTNKTKQYNLSFSLHNNIDRKDNNKIDMRNIAEECKQLSQQLKQTNVTDGTNHKKFIDKCSVNEFLLKQTNVDPQLWENHLTKTKVGRTLDIPTTSNEAVFVKSSNTSANLTSNNSKQFDISQLTSYHSVEMIDKENDREYDFSLIDDQLNNFDSWLKKHCFAETSHSVLSHSSPSLSPPSSFQKVEADAKVHMLNCSTNLSYQDYSHSNIPDYFKRVSEDPPFSPIYEIEEKTPFREKNFTSASSSSIGSLQEQFLSGPSRTSQSSPNHILHGLSGPSRTSQSSPTHILHGLSEKHNEPNYDDISTKLLSLKNDFNQLEYKGDFVQLPAYKDGLNQGSVNKGNFHKPIFNEDNFNQLAVVQDDYDHQSVHKDNFNQLAVVQDDYDHQSVHKDNFNQIQENYYKQSVDDFNQHSVSKNLHSSYINLKKINSEIKDNEFIGEFYPLQPVQQSSLSYVENQALQSSTITTDVVQLNSDKIVNFECNEVLASTQQTVSTIKAHDPVFIKLGQPLETTDGFERFLQPAVIKDSNEGSDAFEHPQVKKVLTNDNSSFSSNGSPLFLPVSCSYQKGAKYSINNSVSTSVDDSSYNATLISKKGTSSDSLQIIQKISGFQTKLFNDHKEMNEKELSITEDKFHRLSPHSSFKYDTFTTFGHDSQLESFTTFENGSHLESFENKNEHASIAHENQQGLFYDNHPDSFLNPSLTFHELTNQNHQNELTNVYETSTSLQLNEFKNQPIKSTNNILETQVQNGGSVDLTTDIVPENIYSFSLKHFDEWNKRVSNLVNHKQSNNNSQQDNKENEAESNHHYALKSIMPYFEDITMDFTARKISGSSFSRTSINAELDSFIPLSLQNKGTIFDSVNHKQLDDTSQHDNKGNEAESNHQYASKNNMPYFEDITMDFTARKISGSSFSRASINVEQDSFIPLPQQNRKRIISDSVENVCLTKDPSKDDKFVKNSQDSTQDYFKDFSYQTINVERTTDNKSSHLNESQLEISNINDFTTELSVLSDLDLSMISGSVDWSSLAPFHESGSSSQESLENILNYQSISQVDLQEKNHSLQGPNQESENVALTNESFYHQNGKPDIPFYNQDKSVIDEHTYHQEQSTEKNNQVKDILQTSIKVNKLNPNSDKLKIAEQSSQIKLDSDIVKEKLFESKKRTKSLYERLPEVKQQNALKEKNELLKRNRAKMKEYHKKLQKTIKKRVKK
ncbi:uncharacterized protein LOC100208035 isoform X2 [Hydra vulgaris]|uniref:uncharacterized protein LOC100208035 isoform X2 n=1 Tax=Hydra vulgaris TaxID=6087 RepID=UPI0032EA5AE1